MTESHDDVVGLRRSPQRRAAYRLAWAMYGREMRRHASLAVPALLLPAVGDLCVFYLPPIVVAKLVARLVDAGSLTGRETTSYIAVFAGLLLLGEVLWRVGLHCNIRAGARGMADLYVDGMDELLAKDAAFFHDNFAGSLTKRVVSYAGRYGEFLDTVSFSVIAGLFPLVLASVVLWRYDPWLVIVLVGLIAVTGGLVAPLIRRRQSLVDVREAAWARVSGHVADTLTNMEAVRAFAAEEREAADHRSMVVEQRQLAIRSWDYSNLRIDTVVAPMAILTSVVGLLIAIHASGGDAGVEALIVTFAFYNRATQIMFQFNQTYRRMETCLTEAAQFTVLILDEPTVLDPEVPEPLRPADASVRFDKVTFAHAGQPSLFRDLDLLVPSGARIGFVGRSGGGKTTLTRLLLRLMDVDGGRILVGGQDISRLRQDDLRSLIAYVPQDPVMFHRSLRDNIAFGRPDASAADIEAAADAAHVTEFVAGLPDGFETLVGERGIKLSGGQRQRVALARAILRDAPVLVLDEATSALDSESEAHIQDALWQLMAGRTALVVAHRLSTVARMDELVVLDRGAVVEQGSHGELLDAGGLYADLWARQSGGFLPSELASA
jgi:ATP-binding cassette, subfamily B, bacterial